MWPLTGTLRRHFHYNKCELDCGKAKRTFNDKLSSSQILAKCRCGPLVVEFKTEVDGSQPHIMWLIWTQANDSVEAIV